MTNKKPEEDIVEELRVAFRERLKEEADKLKVVDGLVRRSTVDFVFQEVLKGPLVDTYCQARAGFWLRQDLSAGVEVDEAVKRYDQRVKP